MLENCYTTKMSSSKKVLQKRFTLIQNNKKISKMASVLSALVAIIIFSTTAFASGIIADLTTDDYRVEISNDGEKIEFINKPFIENGEVYVPLREIVEKVGFMNNDRCYMTWDNGRVEFCIYDKVSASVSVWAVEIGRKEMIYNAFERPPLYETTQTFNNAPILKNNLTYIPYIYFDFLLNAASEQKFNIAYAVYDKNGNLVDFSTRKLEDDANLVSFEPEPEIFADSYSDFLMTNYNQAMTENNLHGTYDYEYVRHWYNHSNNNVDFYYQIHPFGEDETQYLKMSFEKHGDEWIMYNSDVIREIPEDAFN